MSEVKKEIVESVETDSDEELREPAKRKPDPYKYTVSEEYKELRERVIENERKALEEQIQTISRDEDEELFAVYDEIVQQRDSYLKEVEVIYDAKIASILEQTEEEQADLIQIKEAKVATLKRNIKTRLDTERAALQEQLANLTAVVQRELVTNGFHEGNQRSMRSRGAPARKRRKAQASSNLHMGPSMIQLEAWQIHDDMKEFLARSDRRKTNTRSVTTTKE